MPVSLDCGVCFLIHTSLLILTYTFLYIFISLRNGQSISLRPIDIDECAFLLLSFITAKSENRHFVGCDYLIEREDFQKIKTIKIYTFLK